MRKLLLVFAILSVQWGFAQTEAVFPWVTNTTLFKSEIIINNLNEFEIEAIMVATRADGSETAAIRTIGPLGQLIESSASLFPDLGEGPGYCVFASFSAENVTAAFLINAQTGQSGSSPAQADVVELDSVGLNLVFNYLPITPGEGASAPVVVNLGAADAQVLFHAYQNGVRVATSEPVLVGLGRPFAVVTEILFPSITGPVYVIAESTESILGMAFIFNRFLEPSMANARVISAVPGGEL